LSAVIAGCQSFSVLELRQWRISGAFLLTRQNYEQRDHELIANTHLLNGLQVCPYFQKFANGGCPSDVRDECQGKK
jgi:hypothetical protein